MHTQPFGVHGSAVHQPSVIRRTEIDVRDFRSLPQQSLRTGSGNLRYTNRCVPLVQHFAIRYRVWIVAKLLPYSVTTKMHASVRLEFAISWARQQAAAAQRAIKLAHSKGALLECGSLLSLLPP